MIPQTRATEWLAGADLRPTRQRVALATLLIGDGKNRHVTAESLFEAAKKQGEAVSLATVYNTLEAFTEKGLCRRLPASSGSGPSRFDADVGHHAHIMLEDGRVLDLPDDLHDKIASRVPQSVLDEIEARLGVRVEGISLQIAGRQV